MPEPTDTTDALRELLTKFTEDTLADGMGQVVARMAMEGPGWLADRDQSGNIIDVVRPDAVETMRIKGHMLVGDLIEDIKKLIQPASPRPAADTEPGGLS